MKSDATKTENNEMCLNHREKEGALLFRFRFPLRASSPHLTSLPLVIHIVSQFHFAELFLFFLILILLPVSSRQLSLSLSQCFSLSLARACSLALLSLALAL